MEAGGGGAADVHRHRVADVGDAVPGRCPGKCDSAWSKIAGSGLATPTTWLSTTQRTVDAGARADLAHARAPQHGLDLPGRVGHDAERHAGGVERGERRRGSRGSATATAARCGCGRARSAASSTSSSATPTERHVGPVVLVPVALLGALRRLDRHRRVVGAAMAVEVGVTRRSTRAAAPSTVGIGQHQHAAGVQPDGVEAGISGGTQVSAGHEVARSRCRTGRGTRTACSGRRRTGDVAERRRAGSRSARRRAWGTAGSSSSAPFSGIETSGIEKSGIDRSGIERSDRSGIDRSGIDRSADRAGPERQVGGRHVGQVGDRRASSRRP